MVNKSNRYEVITAPSQENFRVGEIVTFGTVNAEDEKRNPTEVTFEVITITSEGPSDSFLFTGVKSNGDRVEGLYSFSPTINREIQPGWIVVTYYKRSMLERLSRPPFSGR